MTLKERVLWIVVACIFASALWVLNVELAYERNIRHIPADFLEHQHARVYNWKI